MILKGGLPKRYIFAAATFFGIFHLYLLRMDLSVAIVAMVEQPTHIKGTGTDTGCPVEGTNSSTSDSSTSSGRKVRIGTHCRYWKGFDWDEKTQGIILSSFFYGYLFLQIPAGYLSDRIGGKHLLGCGILLSSILTLVTPIAAQYHYGALIAVRFLNGVVSGCCYPTMIGMVSVWSPKLERTIIQSIASSGEFLGTFFALVFTGLISDSNAIGGWPSSFYIFGCSGLLWTVCWYWLISSKPEDHPTISAEEKDYIISQRGDSAHSSKRNVPFRSLLTSVPIWACIFTQWTHLFAVYLFMTEIPSFLSKILGFSLSKNGILSGAPYLFLMITAMSSGYVVDSIRSRGVMSISNIRKICDLISAGVPAFCLIMITVSPCDRWQVIAWYWLAVSMIGPQRSSWGSAYVDMAPAYAGTIYGIGNCIGSTTGFAAPALTGALTQNNNNVTAWSHMFYITAGLDIIGTLVFGLFGSAELQPWAVDEKTDESTIEKIKPTTTTYGTTMKM